MSAYDPRQTLDERQNLARAPLLKVKRDFFEWNTRDFCGPYFACADGHCERQRSRRNNFASTQRRVIRIVRQQFDQMPQC